MGVSVNKTQSKMPDNTHQQTKLEIRKLKEWAKISLPLSSTLRVVLLQEDDILGIEEFLIKCSTWTTLARLEDQTKNNR